MSVTVLALVTLGAFAVLAVVFNTLLARIAVVEVILNEGLPPGFSSAPGSERRTGDELRELLDAGVHIFLSRSCSGCRRLAHELQDLEVGEVKVVLRYVDRPPKSSHALAAALGATVESGASDVASRAGADPLPHLVAIGADGLVASGVVPSLDEVVTLARDAGFAVSSRRAGSVQR